MTKFHNPPAFCPEHGLFPAISVGIEAGVTNITVTGCTTNCPEPECDRKCEILPGIYDATLDSLNLLLDPSISLGALAEIRRLTERLQRGEISVSQAKAEAQKISPKAGKLFDIANWSDQAKATLYAAIIGAAAIVIAVRIASSPSLTVNVQPVIERVIQEEKPSLKNDLKSSSEITSPQIPTPPRKPKPPS